MTLCGLSEYIDVTGGVTDTVDYILEISKVLWNSFCKITSFYVCIVACDSNEEIQAKYDCFYLK